MERFVNLSPFNLYFDSRLQLASINPHNGLHGAFSDSLPDGWRLMLMDRVFRQASILPSQITALDRVSFIGDRVMGALSYFPVSNLHAQNSFQISTVAELGLQAQTVIEGVVDAIDGFRITATQLGVNPETIKLISNQLSNIYKKNNAFTSKALEYETSKIEKSI